MPNCATQLGEVPHTSAFQNIEKTKSVKIVVIEGQPLVRYGLVGLLSREPDFAVVGEFGDGDEFCEQFTSLIADVVFVDPAIAGERVMTMLGESYPSVRIIAYTTQRSTDFWWVADAIRAGVQGYVTEKTSVKNIVESIRIVNQGGLFVDPTMAPIVMKKLGRRNGQRRPHGSHLSEREHTVLQLLVEGKRNKEIAKTLFITERTVKFHVSTLLRKFGASTRTKVISMAVQQKLVTL